VQETGLHMVAVTTRVAHSTGLGKQKTQLAMKEPWADGHGLLLHPGSQVRSMNDQQTNAAIGLRRTAG
jgi:hypothetical protein